jgi:tetratricopeptide (TPR) repeat protein
MRRVTLAALLVPALAIGLAGQTSASRSSRDWKKLEAPGLTVMGNAGADDLRRTAASILRFRAAMRSLLPFIRLDPPAPTVAVVFHDNGAMTPFKPRDRGRPMEMVAAYFAAHPDVNYIVMSIGQREFTYQVVFHEYTHLLVNQNISRLPLWLNEGFADFFSTFDGSEVDRRLIVGRPIDRYVGMLVGRFPPTPMSTFIDPASLGNLYRDDLTTARFYAQSWALVHYLLLADNAAHRPALGAFMSALQAGDPPDEIFKRVFGPDLKPLDTALNKYLGLMKLPAIQVNAPEVQLAGDARAMTEADAEQLQGDLLVRTGAFEDADKHLEKVFAIEKQHVQARLSRARSLIAQEHPADARDILSAPDLTAGDDFSSGFLRAEADLGLRHYAAAERGYRHAIEQRPDFAFCYFGLSLAQLGLGRAEAADSFARVQQLSPGPGWYMSSLLASQRLGLDQFAIADATNFVDESGWTNTSSAYAMYIAAMTYLRRNDKDNATAVLESIRSHVPAASWQTEIAAFLEGKTTGEALVTKALSSQGMQTEAHAYIGIKAHIDGDLRSAYANLEWVRDKGVRSYSEYRLALGELDRMDRVR